MERGACWYEDHVGQCGEESVAATGLVRCYRALAGWAKLWRRSGAQVRRRSEPRQRPPQKAAATKTACGGKMLSGVLTLLAIRSMAL
jgi:hypothetical protein